MRHWLECVAVCVVVHIGYEAVAHHLIGAL